MEDNSLPPEVQEEVDRIKAGEPEPEEKPELVSVPDRPLSRRQQAAQETKAEIEAAKSRADEATKLVEEMRKETAETRERFARMEQALDFSLRQQSQPQPQYQQRPQAEGPSVDEQVRKLARDRDKALSDGDLNTYHEHQERIFDIKSEARAKAIAAAEVAALRAQIPQQQQFQKPPWMLAVESQYGDVVMSPQGLNTVAAFMQMDPSAFGPEKLDKAFKRSREELGLAKRSDEKNQQARAMLSGGPTSGGPRPANGRAGRSTRRSMPPPGPGGTGPVPVSVLVPMPGPRPRPRLPRPPRRPVRPLSAFAPSVRRSSPRPRKAPAVTSDSARPNAEPIGARGKRPRARSL